MYKSIFKMLTGLILTVLFWSFCFSAVGLSPIVGMLTGAVIVYLAYRFRYQLPRGLAMAGVYVEVWTGELVKQFNEHTSATFLDGITDYSQYVDKNVIHLIDVGANPDCLLNNTAYPIAVQDLGDGDIAISLDKLQTKATRITDDEMYSSSYDMIAIKREQHGDSLMNTKFNKAIHALAPGAHTAKTPVFVTTGADDGTGRKSLTKADLTNFKKLCDKNKLPKPDRRLVLCADHVADLMALDQRFQDQYNVNFGKGTFVGTVAGFEIHEYPVNPYYNPATKTKLAFGGVPVDGTHYEASVFFHKSRVFTCSGMLKMYYSQAAINPLTQENLINFRYYTITLPKTQEAIGAIVSGKVGA